MAIAMALMLLLASVLGTASWGHHAPSGGVHVLDGGGMPTGAGGDGDGGDSGGGGN